MIDSHSNLWINWLSPIRYNFKKYSVVLCRS